MKKKKKNNTRKFYDSWATRQKNANNSKNTPIL